MVILKSIQNSLVTTNSPSDEKEPATGFALIPYTQVVTEPIKIILNSHDVKVSQDPFQTSGHIFAKLRDPVTKEQRTDAIYSIPCNDCNNEYTFENAILFCKKENSVLSEHICPTNHTIGWDKSKTIISNRRAPLFGTLAYWLRSRSSPPDEGTRQECRKVGSMNCNFLGCIHYIFKPE